MMKNSLCEELWPCRLKFNIAEIGNKLRAFVDFILVAEIKKKLLQCQNGCKISVRRHEENYINKV